MIPQPFSHTLPLPRHLARLHAPVQTLTCIVLWSVAPPSFNLVVAQARPVLAISVVIQILFIYANINGLLDSIFVDNIIECEAKLSEDLSSARSTY